MQQPVIIQNSPIFEAMKQLSINTLCDLLEITREECDKRVVGRATPDGSVIYALDGTDRLFALAPNYAVKNDPNNPNLTTVSMAVNFVKTE